MLHGRDVRPWLKHRTTTTELRCPLQAGEAKIGNVCFALLANSVPFPASGLPCWVYLLATRGTSECFVLYNASALCTVHVEIKTEEDLRNPIHNRSTLTSVHSHCKQS